MRRAAEMKAKAQAALEEERREKLTARQKEQNYQRTLQEQILERAQKRKAPDQTQCVRGVCVCVCVCVAPSGLVLPDSSRHCVQARCQTEPRAAPRHPQQRDPSAAARHPQGKEHAPCMLGVL